MGKFAQIQWPQEYSELQRIEELLLCGICYEYMETSVMTPCSHNYCSLCIRKYLHYKTQCPACFEKTFEKDLHTNRILDEIVSYFGKIREKLAQCIAGAKITAGTDGCDESIVESTRSTPVRPARASQITKRASPKVVTKRDDAHVDDVTKGENASTFVAEQQKAHPSPSTSGISKISTFFTPKSKKNLVNSATSGENVPCPVCAVDVSELHINKHLDACLKRQTATQQPARNPEPKRKPLPKLVFSLMKDAELRKKMREVGLPSQGDRKTLEARFHRYSILYNAECDRKDPRPIEELLKQCENEENLEKKMQKFAHAANRLKITRNCEQNVIEEAQKKYLESNRQNYSDLIATIKERGKTRKAPVRRSLMIGQAVDGCANGVPFSSETVKNDFGNNSTRDEEDPVCYSMNSYEATFHDSDSNSSCPLQHYASDDPMNLLSFKVSTSGDCVSPVKNLPETSAGQNLTLSNGQVANSSSCEVSRIIDVYRATTDDETSDEDVVPPSPNATTSRTTKRVKLTSTQSQSVDNPGEQDRLEGLKLAMSIARDFTFDTSSNDSLGNEAANGESFSYKSCIVRRESSSGGSEVHPDGGAPDISKSPPFLYMGPQFFSRTLSKNLRVHIRVDRSTDCIQSWGPLTRDMFYTGHNNSTLKTANNKTCEQSTVEDRERADSNISKLDKENKECPRVVNRPLRERKCLVRLANVDTTDQTRFNVRKASTKTTERNDDETQRINGLAEHEKLSTTSRLDSPLKRRRGRKKTSNEVEAKDPPRRPLRKRLVKSTSTDNTHK